MKEKIKPSQVFADLSLAVRLEAATVDILGAFKKTIRKYRPENKTAAVEDVCGGKMMFAGPGSPINHAVGMGIRKKVTAADMDRVEAFYRSRKSPIEVMVCPFAGLEFAQLLVKRGYRPTEFENVLVLSMREWKPLRAKK